MNAKPWSRNFTVAAEKDCAPVINGSILIHSTSSNIGFANPIALNFNLNDAIREKQAQKKMAEAKEMIELTGDVFRQIGASADRLQKIMIGLINDGEI